MNGINGVGFSGLDTNRFAAKAQERFESADINQDGEVSKAEFESQIEKVESPAMAEKMFNRMDADGDGVVTRAEHDAGIEQIAERISQFGPGSSTSQSIDTFQVLLESMANNEAGEENSAQLRKIMEDLKLAADEQNPAGLQRAYDEFTQMYPRIDIKA